MGRVDRDTLTADGQLATVSTLDESIVTRSPIPLLVRRLTAEKGFKIHTIKEITFAEETETGTSR